MRRITDAVLTTDPRQRPRLAQAVLAMGLMAAGLVAMNYFAWAGIAPSRPVRWWTSLALVGMLFFFLLIRSGWSRRLTDPSMTVPQMAFAIACSAAAYALLGAGRGGVFPIVMVILMFGMFVVTPQQMRVVSVYAVVVFGLTMAVMAWRRPASYPAAVEIGHFLMVATMMPAMSILAGRLSDLRHQSRMQRAELTQALVRIRELATRDELTGLINQRHMLELMEQEHQRCIRSGQTFCIGVLDIDHLAGLNERLGRDAGDALLRALALESARHVRGLRAAAPMRQRRASSGRRGRAGHLVGRAGGTPRRRDRAADAGARPRRHARGARPGACAHRAGMRHRIVKIKWLR
jgi:diguanylate cyclase